MTKINHSWYPMQVSSSVGALRTTTKIPVTKTELTFEGKKIIIKGLAGEELSYRFSTKKLLDYLMLLLTKYQNTYVKDSSKLLTVTFTLEDYLRIMGLQASRAGKNNAYIAIKDSLRILASIYIEIEGEKEWKILPRIVDTAQIVYKPELITKKEIKTAVMEGDAYFEIKLHSDFVDTTIDTNRLQLMCDSVFKLAGQNERTYLLALKLLSHWSQNKNNPNQTKLKVKTLLACCTDMNFTHEKNIKMKFEEALNLLVATNTQNGNTGETMQPLIAWSYIYDKIEYTADQLKAKRLSYKDWLEAVVSFVILPWIGELDKTTELDTAHENWISDFTEKCFVEADI